jgi:hypothetical protein
MFANQSFKGLFNVIEMKPVFIDAIILDP